MELAEYLKFATKSRRATHADELLDGTAGGLLVIFVERCCEHSHHVRLPPSATIS
jgi:hypothetical protein